MKFRVLLIPMLCASMLCGTARAERWYAEDSCVSRELQDVIFDECEEHGAPDGFAYLMIAMGEHESGGDGKAYNAATDDVGLMQIHRPYAGERMAKLGVSDLFDAEDNVAVSYDILAELRGRSWSDTVLLMAYNEGLYPALRHARQGRISGYARDIISRYNSIVEDVERRKLEKLLEAQEKLDAERKKRVEFVSNFSADVGCTAGAIGESARILSGSLAYGGME